MHSQAFPFIPVYDKKCFPFRQVAIRKATAQRLLCSNNKGGRRITTSAALENMIQICNKYEKEHYKSPLSASTEGMVKADYALYHVETVVYFSQFRLKQRLPCG